MIKYFTFYLSSILLCALICTSCNKVKSSSDQMTDKTTKTVDTENISEKTATTKVKDLTPVDPADLMIQKNSFFGITLGDNIADKEDRLAKALLKTGEADFEVFDIQNKEGKVVGYVMPSRKDKTKVGDIVITAPHAQTTQGIHIGMDFTAAKKILGEVTVHGSEVESHTYFVKDNLRYRLNIANSTYEIDQSTISPKAKIMEISIEEQVAKK